MSRSINRTTLLGHLGRDPEVRMTQAGDKVVTLSIATSENWTDKRTGEKREQTEWHQVVIFQQNLAEAAENYLHKGSRVLVEGKSQTRKWTDNKDIERYTTEVVLGQFGGNLVLLDTSDQDDDQSQGEESTPDENEAQEDTSVPETEEQGEEL